MRLSATTLPVLLLLLAQTICHAQRSQTEDSLCRLCNLPQSDTARITALSNLANYYYNKKYSKEGDSVLNVQLRFAELSGNENLVLKAYFDNSIANISNWSSIQQFDRISEFIKKGIDYSRKINRFDYIVVGYTRLATIMRKRGKYNEAVDAALLALTNMQNVADSLKAVVYIELGRCYRAKNEPVLATTNYNNAFDIAIRTNNYYLQSDIYHCLSDLEDETSEAKFLLMKSVNINRTHKHGEGLIKDYLDLARLEDEDYYLSQALFLADSLHLEKYKFRAKEILLAVYIVRLKDSKKALSYLESQPELKNFYMDGGIENYYYELATIYSFGNMPDSALYFFKMSEQGMLKNYDIARYLYSDIAGCYEAKKDWKNAIDYYLRSIPYYKDAGDMGSVASIAGTVSTLYKQTGNYPMAFDYKERSVHIQDSLVQLTKTREVALLSVERDQRQKDEEARQQAVATTKKRNIQYMSITIAICLVFVGMLVLGMFPISRLTIRLLGYFFFISMFEFIVMVLDNNIIHTITHGEPLKLWLVKIGLIGMLVPIQHFLEHRITNFLESRKLLKARKKFSFKNLFARAKVHSVTVEATQEVKKDSPVA